jgi:hypothetical protein
VAADIISSELHMRPSNAWIKTLELRNTSAFANSAFSKSSRSMALFADGLNELDKLNIIRRNASNQNYVQWKRPHYRQQFALCKDDEEIKVVSAAANASLAAEIDAQVKKAAAEATEAVAKIALADSSVKKAAAEAANADSAVKKAAAEAALADAVILEAETRRRIAMSKLEKPE